MHSVTDFPALLLCDGAAGQKDIGCIGGNPADASVVDPLPGKIIGNGNLCCLHLSKLTVKMTVAACMHQLKTPDIVQILII